MFRPVSSVNFCRRLLFRRQLSVDVWRAENLVVWAKSFSEFQVSPSVSVRSLPQTGFDFVANSEIAPNTSILSVPKEVWRPYSAETARSALSKEHPELFSGILALAQAWKSFPIMDPETDKLASYRIHNNLEKFAYDICLALHLMQRLNQGQDPYLTLLSEKSYPSSVNAMPHPLLLDPSVQKQYLEQTHLNLMNVAVPKFFKVFFSLLLRGEGQQYLTQHQFIQADRDPIQQFLWAMSIVLSRSFAQGSKAVSPAISLVPYLDFVNHANHDSVNCTLHFDPDKETFHLRTTRSILAQESLRINYGSQISTEEFLWRYGIVYGTSDHPSQLNKNDILTLTLPQVCVFEDKEVEQVIPPTIQGVLTFSKIKETTIPTPTLEEFNTAGQRVPVYPVEEIFPEENQLTTAEILGRIHLEFTHQDAEAAVGAVSVLVVQMPVYFPQLSPHATFSAMLHVRKTLEVVSLQDNVQYAPKDIFLCLTQLMMLLNHRLAPVHVLRNFGCPHPESHIADMNDLHEENIRHLEGIVSGERSSSGLTESEELWRRSNAVHLVSQLRAVQKIRDAAVSIMSNDFAKHMMHQYK